jgi:hypothetical protein
VEFGRTAYGTSELITMLTQPIDVGPRKPGTLRESNG